jgi:hypothetical protein
MAGAGLAWPQPSKVAAATPRATINEMNALEIFILSWASQRLCFLPFQGTSRMMNEKSPNPLARANQARDFCMGIIPYNLSLNEGG